MGFKFSSFAAGAAEAVVDTLRKDEEEASKIGVFGVKALKENYEKVMAENRKLESEVSDNIKVLRTFDSNATEAELFAAATNKTYMSMAIEAAKSNPSTFKVGDVVKIKEDNASNLTAMEMLKTYTELPAVSASARRAEGTLDKDTNFFAKIRKGASDRAATRAEEQTAKAMGVSIEQLRAASGFKRPDFDTGAEFDFTSMQKQPSNAKEIKDKLEVAVIQAAQQFGENSPEYVDAKQKIDVVKTQIAKLEDVTDKSLEARVNRLLIKKADSKDPAEIKALDSEIKSYQNSIKQHNQATRATDPKEKQETYTRMKTSINDYVNTRMKDDKGFDWNKYVDFKTFTDPATDTTITSRTQKAGLSIEQQREVFARERQLTAQALVANGYVLSDGTPRTPVAEQLMTNFNISANDLAKATATPATATPATATPATATPAAQPKAAPVVPQLTEEDKQALVWANNPANAGPKADAIKAKIQQKLIVK
jgi:hypothetical protein